MKKILKFFPFILLLLFPFLAFSQWTKVADLPQYKHRIMGFSIGTKGYVVGGVTETATTFTGTNPSANLWIYDSQTDTWSAGPDFPGGNINKAFLFVINDIAYVGSGDNTNFYAYDPSTNTWTQKANRPSASEFFWGIGFAVNGVGYAGMGGSANLYKYTPSTNTWSTAIATGIPTRGSAFVFVYNNKAYIGGGNNGGTYYNTFYQFDPTTNTSTQLANYPTTYTLYSYGYTTTQGGGVASGYAGYNNHHSYNVATNTWAAETPIPSSPQWGTQKAAGFNIGSDLYIIGGTTGSTALNRTIKFTPVVLSPTISATSNLTNFSTCVGFASVTQSFTVNASYLTAPLNIVAPSNFEISTNAITGFASTLTLNPSGASNTISSPIYVRLSAAATGSPTGNVTLSSIGATSVNVAVNGTVNAKPAVPTVSNITACQDLSLPNTFLSALTATGTNLLWYTSATGGVGSATAPTPSASTPGTTSYWVTQTTSGCESDRAQIDVLINPVPTVNQPPNQTIINGTAMQPINFVGTVPNTTFNWTITNSGFGIPSSGAEDIPAYVVNANLAGSPSGGTTIIVTPTANGCVGAPRNILLTILSPWISVNGTINPFSTCEGSPSASQSFNVSGSNLIGPLSISAPYGFEISTNATTGFASTLTLNPSGASNTISSPIYVRLAASATGTPNGNIQFSSTTSNDGLVWIVVSGTVNAKPSAPIVSNITTCPNTNLSALSATGSNLLWYTSATGGVGSATAPTPSASTPGTTSYWVTQTTSGCESDRAQIDVLINPVPTVNQPTNVLVQNGTTTPPVIFTGAVSPTTYAWTSSDTSFGLSASGTGNIASFTANYTGGGNVQQVVSTIVVTPSANGCVGTFKTFTITVNLNAPPTDISLSKANLFEANALGATVGNLSSTDPDVGDTHSYELVGGSGGGDNASFTIVGNQLKANAVFNFAAKRLYAVRIRTTDAGGLPFEKEFLISISKTPIVLGTGNVPSTKKQTAASANPAISKGYASYLTVNGENLTGYSWSPGIGLSANNIANPVANPAQTSTYNVTVTNSFGSTTVVPITITVLIDYNVTPNNLLTPNGDGINDTWAIENIASYPNNEVKVVDKAGRLVFTQKGYANTWDGANLTPDTYYYIIIFGPEVAPKKGFITIIR